MVHKIFPLLTTELYDLPTDHVRNLKTTLNTPASLNSPIRTNLPQTPPDHYSHVLADRFQVAILDNNIGKMITITIFTLIKTLLLDPTYFHLSDLRTTPKLALQII